MVHVVFEHSEQQLQFTVSQCFDYEAAVVTEEEEGAGAASSFARFEDHVSVEFGG